MPERTPYIAANWKMHKTVAEAEAFVDALLPRIAATQHDVVICPSYLALNEVVERSRGSAVRVAAQNMHEEASGAFTGEVSAPMLVEVDVDAVVLGHSERRQYFNETDEALARKVPAALAAGLEPILCVGESEQARDAEQTEGVLERQLQADLAGVESGRLSEVVVAYEPIWAIGTGRTATPEQSQPARASSRAWPGSATRTPTAASSKTRRCWRPAIGPAAARAGVCTCWVSSPTGAFPPAGSTSRRRSSWPRRRASQMSSSTPSPTAGTRCPMTHVAISASWSAGCVRRAVSPRSAAAITRWTATRAGSGPSSPTTQSFTAVACTPPAQRKRSRPPTSATTLMSSSCRR